VAAHSPLNKSKVSLGGALQSYQAGPIQNHRLNFYYAYLIRLRHDMFLSMGVGATGNYFHLSNDKLDVIDQDDPSFVNDVNNSFSPNFGAGAFVYTPSFYFGISMPYALETKYNVGETSTVVMQTRRSVYLSSGYGFGLGKKVYLKPSMLWRMAGKSSSFDVNMQMLYEESFSAGVSYRIDQAVAFIAGFRINKTFQIAYSYDLPMGDVGITKGSHEITLNFDSFAMIRRNKDRRFLKKAKEEEGNMRSIRYF